VTRASLPAGCPCRWSAGNALLAVGGLAVWIAYLLLDRAPLAWASVAILATAALLGSTMLARWIPVYRAPRRDTWAGRNGGHPRRGPPSAISRYSSCSVTEFWASQTFALVLLTVLGVGES